MGGGEEGEKSREGVVGVELEIHRDAVLDSDWDSGVMV